VKYLTSIALSLICINLNAQTSTDAHDFDLVSVYYYNIKGKTAIGIRTTEIKEPFVAVSRDLLDRYPLGSYITLSQCPWAGSYRVMDIMNRRYINTIDVYQRIKKKINKAQCICQCDENKNP
jgi:3D (Asp-Asp-Asp) domain-containing protein